MSISFELKAKFYRNLLLHNKWPINISIRSIIFFPSNKASFVVTFERKLIHIIEMSIIREFNWYVTFWYLRILGYRQIIRKENRASTFVLQMKGNIICNHDFPKWKQSTQRFDTDHNSKGKRCFKDAL